MNHPILYASNIRLFKVIDIRSFKNIKFEYSSFWREQSNQQMFAFESLNHNIQFEFSSNFHFVSINSAEVFELRLL